MSYCTWRDDNFTCDLFCYWDIRSHGWTTHVATARFVGDVPKIEENMLEGETFETFERRVSAEMLSHSTFLASGPQAAIGLPFDGRRFDDPTLEAFRARLLALREAGYRFPDRVIETVDEEIADQPRGIPDGENDTA